MPRPIDPGAVASGPTPDDRREVRAGRTTARAVAVAVALLLVSLLVVNSSRAALEDVPSVAAGTFSTGSVRLSDDDRGRSLIEVEGLVPGDREVECISVTYEGDASPAEVVLSTQATGPLAEVLEVTLDAGTGGGYGNCTTFRSDERLFAGTLAEMADREAIDAFVAESSPSTATFRLTFTMSPEAFDTAGNATADFVWTATPA
jgi:hypothetical protein